MNLCGGSIYGLPRGLDSRKSVRVLWRCVPAYWPPYRRSPVNGQSMRACVRACVQEQLTATAAAVIRSSTHRPAHTARAACWDDAGHRRFPASTAPPTTGKHRRRRRRLPRPKFRPPTRDRFRTIRSRFGRFGPGLSVWATESISVCQGC